MRIFMSKSIDRGVLVDRSHFRILPGGDSDVPPEFDELEFLPTAGSLRRDWLPNGRRPVAYIPDPDPLIEEAFLWDLNRIERIFGAYECVLSRVMRDLFTLSN